MRRASWEWQASVSLNLSPSISCLSVLKTRLLDPPEWSRRKKAKCVARPSMTWFWKSYTVHSTPFSLLEVSHYFAAHISGEEIYPSPWEGRNSKELVGCIFKSTTYTMIRGQLKQNLGLCYKAAGGVHGTLGKWNRASARGELKGSLHSVLFRLAFLLPLSTRWRVTCTSHPNPCSWDCKIYTDQLSAQAEFQIPGPEIWVGLTLVRCSPQAQAAVTDSGELVV